MTQNQLIACGKHYQDILGLGNWNFEVNFKSSLSIEDALAEVQVNQNYDYATIWFAPDYESWDADKANRVLCHELLHVLFKRPRRAAGAAFDLLSREGQTLAWDVFKGEEEWFVEHLTRVITSLAPWSPPKKKTTRKKSAPKKRKKVS